VCYFFGGNSTQYITEYIKTYNFNGLEFDGIAFSSSRNEDGVNLTLFDDSACKFLGSSIHEVTEIKVKSRRLLPLPLEEDAEYGRFLQESTSNNPEFSNKKHKKQP